MGGMLTQPVTNKRSDQGEGLGLRYGLSSMQGWRPEMEDAHDVKIGLKYGLDDWSFFAVFDGHAGKCAAAFAAWGLLEYILRDSQFELGTEDWTGPASIGPHGENLNEPSKVENSSNNLSPTKQSNGGEKSSDSSKQQKDEKLSDDPQPHSELSESPSQSPEGTETKKQQDGDLSTGDKSKRDEEMPKAKFVTSPIIEQLDMVKNAIRSGFLKIDQSLRATAQDMSGCTAVCTLISPTHLFIANCGDSRAVLYDGSSPKFVTEDHKPFNPKERKRIIDAGGTATQRINGTLAVSRALGDFEFKKNHLKGPCEQLVSPEPEVTVIERHPQDEFLILACDGIWDVMNNDDLCQFVRYKLKIEPSLEEVCSSVLDVCLRKGSRDNMSIIIVVFETGPKVDKCEIEKAKKNDEILLEIADSLLEKMEKEDHDQEEGLQFPEFLACLKATLEQRSSPIVPPGAGLDAKYDLLHERYEKSTENHQEKSE